MGFINKRGYILGDPGKRICGRELNQNSKRGYEVYRKNLIRSKEDTELIKAQLKNMTNLRISKN